MRIAVLSGGMPTDDYPLNGIFAFDQAKALQQAGMQVTFLSIDLRSFRRKRKFGYTTGVKDGITWHNISIPIGPIYFILEGVLRQAAFILFKKAFNKDNRPHIIHAHFGEIGAAALALKKRYNIPYVLTEHSSEVNKIVIERRKKERITRYYTCADRLVAVSRALAKNIKNHTSIEAVVIPNIVQAEVFQNVKRVNHKGFRLVTTSNLIPLKRTALIITAMAELTKELPNIYLDVIGDGGLRAELQQDCINKGIHNNVVFHGVLKRDSIAEIYGHSDCFILVSSTETFGVSYIEAMAAGLPVIGTKCGGPEDFINKTNGLIVDVDDVEQIKEAIRHMCRHYQSYRSETIKQFVIGQFSPEIIASKIINLFNEIVNS